jgi:hypothetical protein
MSGKAGARSVRPSHDTSLNREQAVYDTGLTQWRPGQAGKHVLIKGDQVVGFFESRDDALADGYARFGVGPLFVKQVSHPEPVYHIPNAVV